MKRPIIAYCLASAGLLLACTTQRPADESIKKQFPQFFNLTVSNETNLLRKDEVIELSVDDLRAKAPEFNPNAFVVFSRNVELASQSNDSNGDDEADQVIFLADFQPNETKQVQVRYAKSGIIKRDYPKRTQAELSIKVGGKFVNRKYQDGSFQKVQHLRVPPEHTDHSEFIRYEGPGWESDLIGYRFYLDWRNATDIFGKKTPAMVLQNVGLDGFESYHHPADWGMDILKVGESLGIGSIAMWHEDKANRVSQVDSTTCSILADGPVLSRIRTEYFGWKANKGVFDLTSDLSIDAGSHLTRHSLRISANPENLCTGIVQLPETDVITSADENSSWAYLATYGKQSLAEDTLGMAVFYRTPDLIQLTKDRNSHVVVLKPLNGSLTYYFLGIWQQEPNAVKSKGEFVSYLDETVKRLDHPIHMVY